MLRFSNITAKRGDSPCNSVRTVILDPNNASIAQYNPQGIDAPHSYRAREGFIRINDLWADNSGTVYLQGHPVIPNDWGNVFTNGTTTTTTDDTTAKGGGDEEEKCDPCWEYVPTSSGGPREYRNQKGDKFGNCWETEHDYFIYRCRMEHEDDENMKIWYAKQARYAACCASSKDCGWMKGKEDEYIYSQYEITYWADQKTWGELDKPKSPIISQVGGACPEECYGR